MGTFLHLFIYQPLYNVLVFLYNTVAFHDFGIAIILFTVIIRIVLIPLYKKQIVSQKKLSDLQPKIKELQKKHKDNKEEQTKKLMELYKQENANPFGGCLPLIIQMVFIIAIFRIIVNISDAGLNVDSSLLYSFIENPGKINQLFIALFDMTKPSILIAALAAIAQFYQTKLLMSKTALAPKTSDEKEPDIAGIMNKQMLYLGPFLTLFFGIKFPAGLALYWLAGTVFMLVQQIMIEKQETK